MEACIEKIDLSEVLIDRFMGPNCMGPGIGHLLKNEGLLAHQAKETNNLFNCQGGFI